MIYNSTVANLGELCNGSTTDSDSVCWGSNPYSPANRAGFLTCPFLMSKSLKSRLNKGFAGLHEGNLGNLKIVKIRSHLGQIGSQLGHKIRSFSVPFMTYLSKAPVVSDIRPHLKYYQTQICRIHHRGYRFVRVLVF